MTIETATPFVQRRVSPANVPGFERVRRWSSKPERCSECCRRATLLIGERVFCQGCAADSSAEIGRTRELLAKTERVLAEARGEAARGILGFVVPFDTPTFVQREGRWELFERYAIQASASIPVTRGHRGHAFADARTFGLRDGLYFQGDTERPDALVRGCIGVSGSFAVFEERTEPYRGGQLRRVRRAALLGIALIFPPGSPVYKQTWCSSRGRPAWQKVYAPLRAELDRAAADA